MSEPSTIEVDSPNKINAVISSARGSVTCQKLKRNMAPLELIKTVEKVDESIANEYILFVRYKSNNVYVDITKFGTLTSINGWSEDVCLEKFDYSTLVVQRLTPEVIVLSNSGQSFQLQVVARMSLLDLVELVENVDTESAKEYIVVRLTKSTQTIENTEQKFWAINWGNQDGESISLKLERRLRSHTWNKNPGFCYCECEARFQLLTSLFIHKERSVVETASLLQIDQYAMIRAVKNGFLNDLRQLSEDDSSTIVRGPDFDKCSFLSAMEHEARLGHVDCMEHFLPQISNQIYDPTKLLIYILRHACDHRSPPLERLSLIMVGLIKSHANWSKKLNQLTIAEQPLGHIIASTPFIHHFNIFKELFQARYDFSLVSAEQATVKQFFKKEIQKQGCKANAFAYQLGMLDTWNKHFQKEQKKFEKEQKKFDNERKQTDDDSKSDRLFGMIKYQDNGQPTDYLWCKRELIWTHVFGDRDDGKCPICLNDLPLRNVWRQLSDDDTYEQTSSDTPSSSNSSSDSASLNANWHRCHIIPKSAGGPQEAWNCLILCSTCNTTMLDKHAFVYIFESKVNGSVDRLVSVVRLLERINPSLQCRGTLADFVYKNYRIRSRNLDFPRALYETLGKYKTALEIKLDEMNKRSRDMDEHDDSNETQSKRIKM